MEDEAFQPRLPWWLRAPSDDLGYRVYARGYAVASALRLTLPDAMEPSWLGPAALHWLGVVLLSINGCFAGWVACAMGLLLPILLLQDQLTQSGYLLACALAACGAFAMRDGMRSLLGAVRVLTLSVYAVAALHKLNHDFFDPAVSCANAGLGVLADGVGWLPAPVTASFDARLWPILFVACELGLPLLLWRRPALGVTLACLFHIPLTMIFAPGFAFTMMSGWLTLFSRDELRALWRTLRRRRWHILIAGGVPGLCIQLTTFAGRWSSDPDWRIKEIVLWLALALMVEVVTTRFSGGLFRGRGAWDDAGRRSLPLLAAALFWLNALTPYLGLQFHRSGAMLSNLRIDAGCHNHLFIPVWVDPYVRLDDVQFAPGRAAPGVAERARARLWGPEALYRARQEWCAIHDEPLPATLVVRGERIVVEDMCRDPWPLGEPPLAGMRRFQRNLLRPCKQRCIH